MRKTGILALCGILCLAAPNLGAQQLSGPVKPSSPVGDFTWGLELAPGFLLPLGDTAALFGPGAGGSARLGLMFPDSGLFFRAGVDYSYASTQINQDISLADLALGAGIRGMIAPELGLEAHADAGVWYGGFNDLSLGGAGASLAAGLDVVLNLAPGFCLKAGAEYRNFISLWQGVEFRLTFLLGMENKALTRFQPPGERTWKIQLDPSLNSAFPVFYRYYDTHPLGNIEIRNDDTSPVSGLKVNFFVRQYMDSPKEMDVPGTLLPGQSMTVPVLALFTNKILEITEGTDCAGELTLSFEGEKKTHRISKVVSLKLLGRNAMTWDDSRKAAAYVTAKDPQVLNFARTITSSIRTGDARGLGQNLQAALALHEALDLYGLGYVPNPTTPYDQASARKDVIDFLQFPQETFKYRSGDCSDISILYAALLQAVGINTAFITIPGHIYVAFDSGLPVREARAAMLDPHEYIEYQDSAWIPVEITLRGKGFVKAWELGSKEWYDNSGLELVGFYPVQEAWQVYQPVGFALGQTDISLPSLDHIKKASSSQTNKYIDATMFPRIKAQQELARTGDSIAELNRLGIAWARYGQNSQAESLFKSILAKNKDYAPALMNLAMLSTRKGDLNQALALWEQAQVLIPDNARILLAMAQLCQDLKNKDKLKKVLELLKAVDPAAAENFSSTRSITSR